MSQRAVTLVVALLAAGGLMVSLLVASTAAAPPLPDYRQEVTAPDQPARRAAPDTPTQTAAPDTSEGPVNEPPSRPAPRTPRTGADPAGAAESTPAAPAAVGSIPASVRVRAVGIESPVRPVGVARDGQMQLPADPDLLGWYRHGPRPGAGRGAAVMAAHVDTVEDGLGVLARLFQVRRGDPVVVTGRSGQRRAYRVSAIRWYDKQALPARLFARTGPHRLHLVTCGGEYDADRGEYQQNLVVTAIPR
jgi:Sortase domain